MWRNSFALFLPQIIIIIIIYHCHLHLSFFWSARRPFVPTTAPASSPTTAPASSPACVIKCTSHRHVLASFFISSHIVVLLLGSLARFLLLSNSQPADPIIWVSLIWFSFLASSRYSSNLEYHLIISIPELIIHTVEEIQAHLCYLLFIFQVVCFVCSIRIMIYNSATEQLFFNMNF